MSSTRDGIPGTREAEQAPCGFSCALPCVHPHDVARSATQYAVSPARRSSPNLSAGEIRSTDLAGGATLNRVAVTTPKADQKSRLGKGRELSSTFGRGRFHETFTPRARRTDRTRTAMAVVHRITPVPTAANGPEPEGFATAIETMSHTAIKLPTA